MLVQIKGNYVQPSLLQSFHGWHMQTTRKYVLAVHSLCSLQVKEV